MAIDENPYKSTATHCFRCQQPFRSVPGGCRVWLNGQNAITHHPLCFLCAIKLCFMSGKVCK